MASRTYQWHLVQRPKWISQLTNPNHTWSGKIIIYFYVKSKVNLEEKKLVKSKYLKKFSQTSFVPVNGNNFIFYVLSQTFFQRFGDHGNFIFLVWSFGKTLDRRGLHDRFAKADHLNIYIKSEKIAKKNFFVKSHVKWKNTK